uniref:Uncharacterized protein LOC104219921 n=1 Tax=Nicotiana sylvestris TaxID=4096 RepID=A0A1U7VLZ5_NICSY|nr:PREDICTED: uncharacterized protein LOC104219921 [Nicotiana sylvestris]
MPRAKRYQNLQKQVQPSSTSQGAAAYQTASVRTTSQPTPLVRAVAQPAHSVQAISQPTRSVRAAAQPAHSVQAISQFDPSVQLHLHNRYFLQLLHLDMPRAKHYQNLQKSVQPASTSQGVAQPLSTTDSTPSHLDDTQQLASSQPTPSVRAAAHQTVSVRTTSQPAPSVRAAAYSIGKKWSAGKQRLWYELFDPLKTKAEIMDNVPSGIPRDQWTSYVAYNFDKKTMMAESGQMPG